MIIIWIMFYIWSFQASWPSPSTQSSPSMFRRTVFHQHQHATRPGASREWWTMLLILRWDEYINLYETNNSMIFFRFASEDKWARDKSAWNCVWRRLTLSAGRRLSWSLWFFVLPGIPLVIKKDDLAWNEKLKTLKSDAAGSAVRSTIWSISVIFQFHKRLKISGLQLWEHEKKKEATTHTHNHNSNEFGVLEGELCNSNIDAVTYGWLITRGSSGKVGSGLRTNLRY